MLVSRHAHQPLLIMQDKHLVIAHQLVARVKHDLVIGAANISTNLQRTHDFAIEALKSSRNHYDYRLIKAPKHFAKAIGDFRVDEDANPLDISARLAALGLINRVGNCAESAALILYYLCHKYSQDLELPAIQLKLNEVFVDGYCLDHLFVTLHVLETDTTYLVDEWADMILPINSDSDYIPLCQLILEREIENHLYHRHTVMQKIVEIEAQMEALSSTVTKLSFFAPNYPAKVEHLSYLRAQKSSCDASLFNEYIDPHSNAQMIDNLANSSITTQAQICLSYSQEMQHFIEQVEQEVDALRGCEDHSLPPLRALGL